VPLQQFTPPRANLHLLNDVAELSSHLGNAVYIVLETYGLMYIDEAVRLLSQNGDTGCIAVTLGAEDYGIPPEVAARLPGRHVTAKIPTAVQGMSYNVVVSAAIALYEVERATGAQVHPRGENRGTYEAQ